jgi:Ca2+-binding EF-hand superfamily protein
LMGQRSTKELLNRIKDNNDTHHKILQLFRKYDQDRSGYLEGPEYAAFVDALATYIVEGLAHEGVAVHPSVVRLWLKPTLDITRDGRLSFEEVENNLHTALAASLSPSLRHLIPRLLLMSVLPLAQQ